MTVAPNKYGAAFKRTLGDATGAQSALLVPTSYRVLHFAEAPDYNTDWNVSNPTHPTLYVHSSTTPATDYGSFDHDGTDFTINVAGGDMRLARAGTDLTVLSSTGMGVLDDIRLAAGTGETARLIWETADANANELLLELPAGGATDVPVLVIGDTLENDDLGLFNGVVSTTVAIMGSTATATGPSLNFRKSRGTNSAPTVVTTGDDMGSIDFYGAVAADEYVRGARILAEMTGTIATTRGPGVLTFQTATDAAPSVLTTAMTISAAQVVDLPVGDLTVGTSGTTTGKVRLDGATSGTVTVTVAAAAGTWTMQLPAAVGGAGEQLTDAGANGVTSWAAAASKREYKTDIEVIDHEADAALDRMVSRHVYAFRYNREVGKGTQDFDTLYEGVMADEYPEAMHFNGGIVNPINTFGETMLAIKALAAKIERLEGAMA